MAQKVQSVPNPKYVIPPLTTTAPTIVSRRRIKIPVTNTAPKYSGARNVNAGGTVQQTFYFDIADNECFIDLKKLMIVTDFTFHGLKEMAPSFDQNSNAIIARLMIGTSQGLQLENVPRYNLLHNMVTLYTQSAAHKDLTLLDYSDFSKVRHRAMDRNLFIDSIYNMVGQSSVLPETPKRLHLRIHQSSLLENMSMLPLFLFRNGVRFEIELENVYKAFALQHFIPPERYTRYPFYQGPELTNTDGTYATNPFIDTGTTAGSQVGVGIGIAWRDVSWFISAGPHDPTNSTTTNVTQDIATVTAVVAAAADTGAFTGSFAGQIFYGSNYPGPVINNYVSGTLTQRPFHNLLWMSPEMYGRCYRAAKRTNACYSPTANGLTYACFPVSFHHRGQLVWTGFTFFQCFGNHQSVNITTATYDIYQVSSYNKSANLRTTAPAANDVIVLNEPVGLFPEDALVSTSNTAIITGGNTYVNGGWSNHTYLYSGAAANAPTQLTRWANATSVAQAGPATANFKENPSGLATRFFASFLSGYHPQQSPPYVFIPTVSGVPDTALRQIDQIAYELLQNDAEMTIAYDDCFIMHCNTSNIPSFTRNLGSRGATIVHPLLSLWNKSTDPGWTYDLQNVEMLVDLVKPSAEDFLRFQQEFMKPAGIPYRFKRVLYRKNQIQIPTQGTIQIGMHVNVRSLNGLLMCIQDPKCDTEPSDSTRYMLPCLSSFFRKGLTRAEVIVGGQQFPIYPLYFKPNWSGQTVYGQEQIPEAECFFGVSGSGSFNPSFTTDRTYYTRNYLACGLFDKTYQTWVNAISSNLSSLKSSWNQKSTSTKFANYDSYGSQTNVYDYDPFPLMGTWPYLDSSAFVVGFSLNKDDQNSFATGIDSSQSGAVNVNLYFQDSTYSDILSNPIDIHTFLFCDAIATFQSDANLVRF